MIGSTIAAEDEPIPASPNSSPSSIDTRRESSVRAVVVASAVTASLVVVIAGPNSRPCPGIPRGLR